MNYQRGSVSSLYYFLYCFYSRYRYYFLQVKNVYFFIKLIFYLTFTK